MAIENEEDQNDNTQQQMEDIPLATSGDEEWDKIIDGTIEKGANPNAQANDGKTADDKAKSAQQQVDPNKQKTDDTAKQRQEPTQDQGTQQTRSAARKFGNLFQSDQQGNIYDTNGALIAKQGAQRAVFHRMYPQVEAMSRELNGVRETIKNYENANEIAKREGLSLDEHGAALQMFAQWKKDPVKTLSTLLTLAEQGGRDISAIRQSTGPAVSDIRSVIQEVVQEAIKPFSFLTQQQEQQREQQELLESVQTEYAAFIEDFPDAKIHEQAIANVMRDKGVPNREAYFALRTFAAENGLDWKQPLAEQLVARNSKQQQRNPSGDGQNRRLPPMGGRNRSEATHVANGSMDQANADDSWDAIARQSMRAHGIAID